VWADDLRHLDEGAHPRTIRPAKGVHITVPWNKVRNDIAVVIPVPKDKRSLFVVPWVSNGDGTYKYTYIGTTDTDYKGPIDEPQCTKDDIDYVLRALNASVTTDVTHDDVLAVWSGLRPLVTTTSDSKAAARTADTGGGCVVQLQANPRPQARRHTAAGKTSSALTRALHLKDGRHASQCNALAESVHRFCDRRPLRLDHGSSDGCKAYQPTDLDELASIDLSFTLRRAAV
jgi:glycerol-3-phosphate dehydrogenase